MGNGGKGGEGDDPTGKTNGESGKGGVGRATERRGTTREWAREEREEELGMR